MTGSSVICERTIDISLDKDDDHMFKFAELACCRYNEERKVGRKSLNSETVEEGQKDTQTKEALLST